MIKHLYIKNFTLIDTLDIDLHPGFSVITGETGAGKSIILGAIGLLLGQRADSKAIKQGSERCTIEAEFDLTRYTLQSFFDDNDIDYDEGHCIIRRELTAAGKSRAFINDTPVQLSQLKELGEMLMDVHSQHQNLLLNKHDFQLNVVDIIGNTQSLLDQYRQHYVEYQRINGELAELKDTIARNQQNADFLQFQYQELSAADLKSGELEELELRNDMMSHSEDIKTALYTADVALHSDEHGIITQLRSTANALKSITHVLPDAQGLAERLDSTYIELKDIADEVGTRLEQIDFDPQEFDAVNQRLDLVYTLLKKYQVETIDELIARREQLKQQLAQIENGEESLLELQQRLHVVEAQCQDDAHTLNEHRTKAARTIEEQMLRRLVQLGMPHVRFQISITPVTLGPNGADQVSFLFSANTSTPLQPVLQVASGGEIARVMLSLKAMISGAVKLPTIIFDEIDTGVSGKMAERMAEIMKEMGAHERQVISITHLPQIAALGTSHYKVVKDDTPQGTTSRMTELTPQERIHEIAQMLSGSDITDAAIQNAKELLKLK